MSGVIREYYVKAHTMPVVLEQKVKKFEQHPDIKSEFEDWISTKQYKDKGAVIVDGYTAKSLSDLSPYLKGEGAYMLLMELRDDPERAKKRIKSGFKRK